MNSRPMILRFSSGSLTPASASRKRFSASTTCRSTPVAATKSRSTCSASPLRSSPWSTKTQVSRSPIARCTTAAATAESTPPDSPQIARPESPICSRIRSICSSTMLTIVQVGPAAGDVDAGSARAPSGRARCAAPRGATAPRRVGGRCSRTPPPGSPRSRRARRSPSGARCTESPCDIQTRCSAGCPPSSVPGGGDADRRPAVLRDAGAGHLAAEHLGHRLEAVADAEDRHARLEQVGVDAPGRPARRPTRGHPRARSRPGFRASISATGMCAARSRSRPSPRAPGGRSAGRTGLRNRRRERGRGRSRWALPAGRRVMARVCQRHP